MKIGKAGRMLTEKQTSFFKDKSHNNMKELERAFRDVYMLVSQKFLLIQNYSF